VSSAAARKRAYKQRQRHGEAVLALRGERPDHRDGCARSRPGPERGGRGGSRLGCALARIKRDASPPSHRGLCQAIPRFVDWGYEMNKPFLPEDLERNPSRFKAG
jgi:hypothetical protein